MPWVRSWRRDFVRALAYAAALIWSVGTARAIEPYLEFVHALQQHGYGEMAVFYLESIHARPDLPEGLREQ